MKLKNRILQGKYFAKKLEIQNLHAEVCDQFKNREKNLQARKQRMETPEILK